MTTLLQAVEKAKGFFDSLKTPPRAERPYIPFAYSDSFSGLERIKSCTSV